VVAHAQHHAQHDYLRRRSRDLQQHDISTNAAPTFRNVFLRGWSNTGDSDGPMQFNRAPLAHTCRV
jgi:hypothetical protein